MVYILSQISAYFSLMNSQNQTQFHSKSLFVGTPKKINVKNV